MLNFFKGQGLVALPGRHFYWNQNGHRVSHNSLRFSLLKTKFQFERSIAVLKKSLKELE